MIPILLLWSCHTRQSPPDLKLIPADETVERVKQGNFDYSYAVFKNQNGEKLSQENRNLLNQGKLAKDYYEDENGKIKEVRVRPLTLADQFIEIQRRELSTNPLANIDLIAIDCNRLDSIYAEVERTDQEVRNEGGNGQAVDRINQQIVISTLTTCGWSEAHLHTIWLVFQHAPTNLMAYYYPTLKEYSLQGKIERRTLALMEDRLLMNHGYPQIYGSQISNGYLYDLADPDNVNKRRAEIGLEPIEDYLSYWDLNFEKEKERMNRIR